MEDGGRAQHAYAAHTHTHSMVTCGGAVGSCARARAQPPTRECGDANLMQARGYITCTPAGLSCVPPRTRCDAAVVPRGGSATLTAHTGAGVRARLCHAHCMRPVCRYVTDARHDWARVCSVPRAAGSTATRNVTETVEQWQRLTCAARVGEARAHACNARCMYGCTFISADVGIHVRTCRSWRSGRR